VFTRIANDDLAPMANRPRHTLLLEAAHGWSDDQADPHARSCCYDAIRKAPDSCFDRMERPLTGVFVCDRRASLV
jgi:hypothetical protein